MDQLLGRRRERLTIKKQEPPEERALWRTGRRQSSSQSGSGADTGRPTWAAAAGPGSEEDQETYHPTGPAAAATRRAPAGNLAGKWEKIKNLVEDMVYGDKEEADGKRRPDSGRSKKDSSRPSKEQPRKGDETDSEAVSRFRWSLYQKQVQPSALGGRCQVSRRAQERNEEQRRCPHQHETWSGEATERRSTHDARYAS